MIWTFLIITYGAGDLHGFTSVVAMPSQEACEDASAIVMENLLPIMPDVMTQCVPSGVPSQKEAKNE